MIHTVIFDVDGTLLDTIEDLAAAGNYVCRENGWPEHSVAEFRTMVGHGMANLVARFSPPEAQDPAQLSDTLRRFGGYYGAHGTDHTRPYPGIEALLSQLKGEGRRLAVYSNKADTFSQALIDFYFPGVFDLVKGKVANLPVKPDPAGIHAVMTELGADPVFTLFVGDSSVDIQTGHNASLRACGVTWGFRSRESLVEAGADFLADTAAELGDIIRRA